MGKDDGRGKLEVIRDVLVIIVCLVILASVFVGGFLAMRYGPQVYKVVSSAYGVVSDLTSTVSNLGGSAKEFISTGSNNAASNPDLCSDLLAAQNAFTSGDAATASAKLSSAETAARSKGLTKVVKLLGDVKKAVSDGNTLGVLSARTALNNELGCE